MASARQESGLLSVENQAKKGAKQGAFFVFTTLKGIALLNQTLQRLHHRSDNR